MYQGLFNRGSNIGGWQATDPTQGNQTFDFSGVQAGVNALNGLPGYSSRSFSPSRFTHTNMQAVGPYGTSTPQEVSDTFSASFAPGMRNIRSQGNERMRQMGQGFEGARFGGAARRQLALRNAQQTGSDIQDLSSGIGANITNKMFEERGTARDRNFSENQNVRDQNWAHQNQIQEQNANELFRYNQFSDEQARYMAEDAMARANAIANYGLAVPGLQGTLSGTMLNNWNAMNNLMNQQAGYARG